MDRSELRTLQWNKLAAGLDQVFASNGFYRSKFAAAGLTRDGLRSWADFEKIPFTAKEELLADQQLHPPYGTNLTNPAESYLRIHQTSGSSGRRLRWLDDRLGWNWILDCWDFLFDAAGVTAADRFLVPFSFGPFLAFWGAFESAFRRGQFVIPGGGLSTLARLRLIQEHRLTFILCTPTYALRLIEVAQAEGIDLAASTIRGLILAGEPGASIPSTRGRIESAFAARVFDHCGMTEIGSLGVEFVEQPGRLYLMEDQAIAEFVVPGSDTPAKEGQAAELVLTNLGRWGSPLLRYRTGDRVRWRPAAADSAYPFVYLEGGIQGRTDDMLWIKGNNVFPSTLEAVLMEFAQVAEYALEVDDGRTNLTIVVEPAAGLDEDWTLLERIGQAFADRLYFRPQLRLAPPGSLQRAEAKSRRVIDRTR